MNKPLVRLGQDNQTFLLIWRPWCWYFRVGGRGFSFQWHHKGWMMHSERNGLIHPRPFHVGNLCLRLLTPKETHG